MHMCKLNIILNLQAPRQRLTRCFFFKKLLTLTLRNSLKYTYREEEMAMMTVNEVSKLTGVSTDAIQRVLSQESVDIRNLFL